MPCAGAAESGPASTSDNAQSAALGMSERKNTDLILATVLLDPLFSWAST
jgi:hypothetical protein